MISFAERLRLLAVEHGHHLEIRVQAWGIELVRMHEPVIIDILYWNEIENTDLIARANQAIEEHGLSSGNFMNGSDWYCQHCRMKLTNPFEICSNCSPASLLGLNAQSCHICGCTDEDCSICVRMTGKPCSWVHGPGEAPLCSACRDIAGAHCGRWLDAMEFEQIVSDEMHRSQSAVNIDPNEALAKLKLNADYKLTVPEHLPFFDPDAIKVADPILPKPVRVWPS